MKKGVIVALVIAIILVLFISFKSDDASARPIGESVTITLFESGGETTGSALVSIPFLNALQDSRVSVSLDFNDDESYDESEKVVDNAPLRSRADWKNGFYFPIVEDIETLQSAQVEINGTLYDVGVNVETQDVGKLMELETITDPENAMKGLGIAVANAQTDLEIFNDDVPDINQRPGECAPTSAANSLIDLVRENGTEEQQLGDPTALIDDLKNHMNWTRANGVLPDPFVAGKNSWAAANNLPIITTKVGDTHGVTTFEAISEALEDGDAVELRIKFTNAAGTAIVGGHMVTVTGIHVDGDETYLDINDPNTVDSGTEQVEISSNQIKDYGPYGGGLTLLSWGFVQSWTGASTQDVTGTSVEEAPKSAVTEEEPKTENKVETGAEPISDDGPSSDEQLTDKIDYKIEGTFAHVKPGEYSEVYAVLIVKPGTVVEAALVPSPGVAEPDNKKQTIVADENGQVHVTWRIYSFGTYAINMTIDNTTYFQPIDVK